jgi:hypothetical protein
LNARVSAKLAARFPERRREERFIVELPGTVSIAGESYPVRVVNVALGGAMFATREPMDVRSKLILRCGTIVARATVEWQSDGCVGVRFAHLLSDRDVAEQRSRSIAVAALREQCRKLHRARL